MTTISIDKQYTTRDGASVELITNKARNGTYPVVGYIGANCTFAYWDMEGSNSDRSDNDLIEAKPRVQCEVWIWRNEIGGFEASVWSTPKGHPPVARVPIDVEEGHGLDCGELAALRSQP